MIKFRNPKLLAFLSLIVVTPLGFYSKYYTGIAQKWVHDYSGDILYEIFWCLLIFLFIPKKKAISKIALWVFAVTCFLEILQLWKPPFLQLIRKTLIGKFVLGTTFVWWDFIYYLIGSLMGWLLLQQIWQFCRPPRSRRSSSSVGDR